MKKRRLNKKGKILVTIITILASVLIYILMAKLGTFAKDSIFILFLTVCGWSWLILGQTSVLALVWED